MYIMKKVVVSEKTGKSKLRIAAYCRVSTDRAEQKHSFESQQRYFQTKFSDSLVEVYSDTASGTSAICRPGFQKLLADCHAGKIDRIVTKSLSRFARNTKECLVTLRELKKIGVTVLFEKEGIDTARVSDEIMITVMEGLAQEEAASISRNTRWGIRHRMENGTFGIARVPYGYEKINGQLVINEQKADIVRQIFSLYLSGEGAKKIAAHLNDRWILSPTGTKWNNVTVLKILRQEKYIGDIRWQKTYSVFMGEKSQINHGERDSFYIRDCLPPIISREDFAAVRERMEKNTRHPQNTLSSVFRGKMKCICGRSFYLRGNAKKIWECTGKYDLVRPCDSIVFSDIACHRAWNRMCLKLRTFPDDIIITAADLMKLSRGNLSDEEINALYEREEELSSRKYVLYSLGAEGCITAEKLLALTNEIDRESEKIGKKLSFLEKQSDEMIKELDELYRLIKNTSSAELAEMILKNAVSDGRTIEFELSGGLKFREVLS